MTASGEAHSGMIAKLAACGRALDAGVRDVSVVSGRGTDDYTTATGTRIARAACRA
jgi:acetylglutamate kinase